MRKLLIIIICLCLNLFGVTINQDEMKLLNDLEKTSKQIDKNSAALLNNIEKESSLTKEQKKDFLIKNAYLIKKPTVDDKLLEKLKQDKEKILGEDTEGLTPQQKYLKKQQQIYKQIKTNIKLLGSENSVWDKMVDQSFQEFKTRSNFEEIMSQKGDGASFTVFYMIDSLVNDKAILNFAHSISKLKKKYPMITGRVVLRNWIDGDIKQTAVRFRKIIEEGGKDIKVNPINWEVFDGFNLQEVPAYALSYCNESDFWFKRCDNRYLVKGDVGLIKFFEILGDNNKLYKKYYFDLIETEKDHE